MRSLGYVQHATDSFEQCGGVDPLGRWDADLLIGQKKLIGTRDVVAVAELGFQG
ncbi:hypothetical protein IH799_08985 [candidate division KSB1 bacterium]|nr:hypothetical protein [candidate division KSB1 bacterium]